MELPERKPNRLSDFDYGQPGAYFITFCTQNRRCILSRIVGGGAHDAPHVELTPYGKIVEKYILSGNRVEHISVDKYVIMPNHVHMILSITDSNGTSRANSQSAVQPFMAGALRDCESGRRGRRPLHEKTELRPSPTNQTVPHFISTLKRFCHSEMGEKVFQRSFHDHVIRNDTDYREIWEYIDRNPAKWNMDRFYELCADGAHMH